MINFQPGQQVSINVPAGHILYTTAWWPKPGVPVSGRIEKVYKNGKVAVAVDQVQNRSADMRKTMNIPSEWLRGGA